MSIIEKPMFLFSLNRSNGPGGEDTGLVEKDTKDNQGPKKIIIKLGEDDSPGEVVEVVRVPKSPKKK